MPEPILKIPITCPRCAFVSLAEMPIVLIANGLLTGKANLPANETFRMRPPETWSKLPRDPFEIRDIRFVKEVIFP